MILIRVATVSLNFSQRTQGGNDPYICMCRPLYASSLLHIRSGVELLGQFAECISSFLASGPLVLLISRPGEEGGMSGLERGSSFSRCDQADLNRPRPNVEETRPIARYDPTSTECRPYLAADHTHLLLIHKLSKNTQLVELLMLYI
jgi:hypothetical protein